MSADGTTGTRIIVSDCCSAAGVGVHWDEEAVVIRGQCAECGKAATFVGAPLPGSEWGKLPGVRRRFHFEDE